MSVVTTADELCGPIIRAIGIDTQDKLIRRVVLTLEADALPTLTVTSYVRDGSVTGWSQAIEQYDLTPRR